MTSQTTRIETFLQPLHWAGADSRPLAGDASARRYDRLFRGAETAVLMIAPPGEEMHRFRRVDDWLRAQGFSAPRILGFDADAGLMLLEDFGDDQLARLLRQNPEAEAAHYAAITEFLLELHRQPPPDFVLRLDGPGLAALLDLMAEWYPSRDRAAAQEIGPLVAALHDRLEPLPPVLSLRDFHAENVIWLPDRAGSARLGLLDFQDAVVCHPAYDLVSALQDARRDLDPAVQAREIAHYATARGIEHGSFATAVALLGAQRALRILGIFVRLCLAQGKPQYVDLIPRVWRNLLGNLRAPGLEDLRRVCESALCPPDDALLERMRQECGQHPMR